MSRNTTAFWNERITRASRTMRCMSQPVMSVSPANTRPAVGFCNPVEQSNSVDLPDPFGPVRPQISPAGMARSTPATATMGPNRFSTPWMRSAGFG